MIEKGSVFPPELTPSLSVLATFIFLKFSTALKKRIKERQHHQCGQCGENRTLEVHHIVPQSRRGSDHEKNAVALCQSCHRMWDAISLTSNLMFPGKDISEYPAEHFRRGRQRNRKKRRAP